MEIFSFSINTQKTDSFNSDFETTLISEIEPEN